MFLKLSATHKLAKLCDGENSDGQEMIGAVADVNSRKFGNPPKPQSVKSVIHEENQQKFVWERGCIYGRNDKQSLWKCLNVSFFNSREGMAFDNYKDVSSITPSGEDVPDSTVKALTCVNICLKSESASALFSVKNVDILQVSGLLNTSEKSPETSAPVAACIPGLEEARFQSLSLS